MRGRARPAVLLAAALAAALSLSLVAPAGAQEVGSGVAGFGLGDWFGLVTRLALVVLVIWAAVYGMRWYVRRMNGGPGGRSRQMEILETHSLGPNRALHLVRLGDRAVLIGATPERINSLMAIDDPDEVERLAETPEELERSPLAPPRVSASVLRASLSGQVSALRARFGRPRVTAPAVAMGEAAAAPTPGGARRGFSLANLVPSGGAGEGVPEQNDEPAMQAPGAVAETPPTPAPATSSSARAGAGRRSAILAGLRRLPRAFRTPARAPRPAAGEASTEAREAAAAARPGLFERALAASREAPVAERYAPGGSAANAAGQPGGFSAALAAMEARDGAQVTPAPRRAPREPRPRPEREAVAERAGLSELASDPQAFSRMSREQQIAQVQRAILAARESTERSA